MPIYEYVCGSCKRKTEVIQRMNEARLKVCPHCGGKLTKMFSAPAIQFKGSGFYITDYARAKGEEGGGKSKGAEKSGGGEKSEGGSAEKSEKSESSGKSDKAEKAEKAEKADKKSDRKKDKKAAD